mgnify:CR=1 FL=1
MKYDSPPPADVEFYYLLELTRRNIKPMSRREHPITEEQFEFLKSFGFAVAKVPRMVLNGHWLKETVFGKPRYVRKYERTFSGTSLTLSPDAQRLEGFLFGYPSCCVRQFIRQPYKTHDLPAEDQEVLFHWACPDCRMTPSLMPYYLQTHQEVWDWFRETFPSQKGQPVPGRLKTSAAALLAATLLGVSSVAAENDHQLPVPGDTNNNGLVTAEEVVLGSFHSYQDAVYWGNWLATTIDSLPSYYPDGTPLPQDSTYRIEHLTCGEYPCPVCGVPVNMGYMDVINPMRDLTYTMSYVEHHFLANGSFSSFIDDYSDTTRIDITELKRVLFPYDSAHRMIIPGDADNDAIPDSLENYYFHFDPGNWDTDDAGIPDGVTLTERLTALLPKLMSHQDSLHTQVDVHPAYGLETCSVCGAMVNMGFVEFTNPETGWQREIPLINLHALAHGSFMADGSVHPENIVQPDSLSRLLNTHHLFIKNDQDSDGLTDSAEVEFGSDPLVQDTDQDGISDARALANRMVNRIEVLPTEEQTDQPYVLHFHADGVYNCLVCGNLIDMGHMEIYNPLINTAEPLRISYHLYHFIQHGSFAMFRHTYEGWDEAQVDPVVLANYINLLVATDDDPGALPEGVSLYQNYPNPFNAETLIQFVLPEESQVSLAIYNTRGQMERELFQGAGSAGLNTIHWDGKNSDGTDVPSGIYLYKLDVGNRTFTKKLTVLR